MARILLVLCRVHILLPVLDAHSHGKGLGGHGHPRAVQHFHRVPGTVAQRQQRVAAGQRIDSLLGFHGQTCQASVLYGNIRQLVTEPEIGPQGQQLPPQVPQDNAQPIGTYMGLGVPQDILRRAVFHQPLHDPAMPHISGAGVQLSVRERPCASLAELDIGLRIQYPALPKPPHILLPLLHAAAPLQYDGLHAAFGQHQRREQARRPHAHHNGRQVAALHRSRKGVSFRRIARNVCITAALQKPRLVFHLHRRSIHEPQAVPGVDGPAQYLHGRDILLPAAQHGGSLPLQLFRSRFRGELNALQPQHDSPSAIWSQKVKNFKGKLKGTIKKTV